MFEIKTSPGLNIGSVTVKKENVGGLYYEFIGRTQENYGIQGYIELQEKIKPNEGGVISVSQVGSVHAQLRNKSWYGSQNIFILKPFNEKLLNQYLITAVNKKLNKYNISYTTFPTLKTLKEETIYLPTYSNGELAYDYMENYIKEIEAYHIKEIEAYHIKEIEAYLKATGLSDYNLTKDEVESLKTISMGGGRKFTLVELFEVSNGNIDIQKNDIEDSGEIVISAGEGNYGIVGKTTKQAKIFEKDTITIDMFGYSFLRNHPYKMVTHGRVMSLNPQNKNRYYLLYLLSSLQYLKNRYGFDNMLTWKKIREEEIALPVNSDNQIDYPLIETYIKATQKLVIKDLVDKVNKKLETYSLAIIS